MSKGNHSDKAYLICEICRRSKIYHSIYSLQYHLTTSHPDSPDAILIQEELRLKRKELKK